MGWMNPTFQFEDDDELNERVPAWEIRGTKEMLAEEHRQRKTTSLMDKISALKQKANNENGGVEEGSEDEVEDEEEGEQEEKEDEEVDEEEGEEESEEEEDEALGGADEDEDEEEEEEEDYEQDTGAVGMESDDDALDRPLEELLAEEDEGEEGEVEVRVLQDKNKKSAQRKNGAQNTPQQKQETTKKSSGGFFEDAKSAGAKFSASSFSDLQLSRPLLRACAALGYEKPTPIQAACIPLGLAGRDISGSAITGSGKTAAFSLPVLERLLYRPRRIAATRVLVLTPTRELAAQVHGMIEKLAQFTDIRACLVVGGLSIKAQEAALRSRPDIVVATPGRLVDHLHNAQSFGVEDISILVLDEADRLLALGFREEVNEIVRQCPKNRQTLLFSATMSSEVQQLVDLSLRSPVRLSADPSTQRPKQLKEEVVRVRATQEGDREAMLLAVCSRLAGEKEWEGEGKNKSTAGGRKGENGTTAGKDSQGKTSSEEKQQRAGVIVFSGRKAEAHRLRILFGLLGFQAGELHGNLTQTMRLDALESFRRGNDDFLIATDVAARGLDIVGVRSVVNFHTPRDVTTYVHRVGRTARAGRGGVSVTFVGEKDRHLLKGLTKRAGRTLLSRSVAKSSVDKWRKKIEELESDIATVLKQEREEQALRRAEMETVRAENMLEHEAEIYSKPKRTWFQTGRERMAVQKAAKAQSIRGGGEKEKGDGSVQTMTEAQEQRRKEKMKKEREKRLPRKKRRRLEAEREAMEDESGGSEGEEDGGQEKKSRKSLADMAYVRAKAAKSASRKISAGKLVPLRTTSTKKTSQGGKRQPVKSKSAEMHELFSSDMKEKDANTKKMRVSNTLKKKSK